jgi:hypothetical protein
MQWARRCHEADDIRNDNAVKEKVTEMMSAWVERGARKGGGIGEVGGEKIKG